MVTASPTTSAIGQDNLRETSTQIAPVHNGHRAGQTQAAFQLDAMLKLADAHHCQLRVAYDRPGQMKGLCPFHVSRTVDGSFTLFINPRTGDFACQRCGHHGDAIAFISTLWRVAIPDTIALLQNITLDQVRVERPIPDLERLKEVPARYRSQNTGVLTRAMDFYRHNLTLHYPSLYFLASLGINPEAAHGAPFGFSPGYGLLGHLESAGVTPEEIAESSLFDNGQERIAGRIVIADTDPHDNVMWMASIPPTVPNDPRRGWSQRRPNNVGLPGRRPYLLGLTAVPRNTNQLVLTDDLRLYLVLKYQGITAAAILEGADPQLVAQSLMRRTPRTLCIITHNQADRNALRGILDEHHPDLPVYTHPKIAILKQLHVFTRDLEALWQHHTPTNVEPDASEHEDPDALSNPERPTNDVQETLTLEEKPTPGDSPGETVPETHPHATVLADEEALYDADAHDDKPTQDLLNPQDPADELPPLNPTHITWVPEMNH